MVTLRGISTRGQSQVRKFSKELSTNKLNRKLTSAVRGGDSISSIREQLRIGGVKVTRTTLERSLYNLYNVRGVARYYDRTRTRYGSRSGFSQGALSRIGASNTLLVKVKGTTKTGETYNFQTYVNVSDSTSLTDILDKLKEIYEEDNESNKSPLKDIQFQ